MFKVGDRVELKSSNTKGSIINIRPSSNGRESPRYSVLYDGDDINDINGWWPEYSLKAI